MGTFLFPQTPCQWKQTRTHRVNGNRIGKFLAITSTHSKNLLTLILSHHKAKSLTIKAFHYPFHSKVSRLLRAVQHTQRFAVTASLCSATAIAWAEHLLVLRADKSSRTSSDTAST